MFKTANALVLREVKYKEADRILTLLSDTDGKITVKARGALRKSSKTAAATQQLTYSEMTLFGNAGRYTVNEAIVKEGFMGLREDFEAFALGTYFAECLEALTVEDQPEAEVLQLGLNCLYALSNRLAEPLKIKAAFELRLMALSGYAPELSRCSVCGEEKPERIVLLPEHGCICCSRCVQEKTERVELDGESLEAMRYILRAPAKKLLSFTIGDIALRKLSRAAERYLLTATERGFSSLDYWKKIKL